MFSKPLKDLEFKDIEELTKSIDRNEGYKFDFKGAPKEKDTDKFEDKLIQSFTAFANAYGGYLILGVNETDKKSKTFELNGFPQTIKGKNTIEWINQVISGNIEPKLFYPDPQPIEIPDSDKRILVYHIPESSVKPHMNNKEGKYYIRINDKSEPAKHYTVRDMFETSRRRYDELQEFLDKRNLLNENNESFGLNTNSRKLKSDYFKRDGISGFPFLLISFIPKLPYNEIIHTQKPEFKFWLNDHAEGHEPTIFRRIFSVNHEVINLNGISFMSYDKRSSYIVFLNNGFFEQGLCDSVFYRFDPGGTNGEEKNFLHITNCIGQLISLINFSKKYFDYISYNDEIILQLSFVNVINFSLTGINEMKGIRQFRSHQYYPCNTHDNKFKIIEKYHPNSLSNSSIIQMSKDIAVKVLNAFGTDDLSLCFINDQIDRNLLSQQIRYIL